MPCRDIIAVLWCLLGSLNSASNQLVLLRGKRKCFRGLVDLEAKPPKGLFENLSGTVTIR